MIILKNKLLSFVLFVTVLLCLAFALNFSPYLRGPNDLMFESHWPYYFINTVNKIWAPLLVGISYILFFAYIERKNIITFKKEILFLTCLIVLIFLFQISLVYFSRFGITVLFRRIVDPGINGYFTAATKISNLYNFFVDYPKLLVTSLPQHSRGDPPGPILIMYMVINIFKSLPLLTDFLHKFIRAPMTDAQALWSSLVIYQRVSAVFLGFFMHLLSAISVVPIYYLVKTFSNSKASFRAAFIWGVIPSVTFFSLLFDPFYTIFPSLTFLTLVLGYKKNDLRYFLLSGLICSLGFFFNLSFLPLLFFLVILFMQFKEVQKFNVVLSFLLGVLIVPSALLILGYDSISSGLVLIKSQTPRSYVPWLFYNVYDVFVYMGIAISILFSAFIFQTFKYIKSKIYNKFIYAYLIMFVALVISGISRGEAGRIWIPLMIFPVGFVAYYSTLILKYKSLQIILVLSLLIFQCIILEEFWVPIW